MAQQQAGVREHAPSEAQLTEAVRDLVLAALLDKIAGDRFPSTTMMDQVEDLLTPARLGQYVKILLDKVHNDRFPSSDILQRLIRLSG